jgi:hypothetical protein
MHFIFCLNNPNETNNWVCCVRNEICRIGLSNLWHAQQSLCKEHLVIIKQRLYDIAKQELDEILSSISSMQNLQFLFSRLCDDSLVLIIYFLYNSGIGLVKYVCI